MSRLESLLRWSLYAGAIFFFSVAIAHMTGSKIPFLYIYYNIPSYEYQDKIISFLACGWAVFLFIAGNQPSKQLSLLSGIIVSGVIAIAGLTYINIKTDFAALEPTANAMYFWLETGCLACYLILLLILNMAIRAKRSF